MRSLELKVALRWHTQVYSKPHPKGWAPWQLLLQPGGSDDLVKDPLCNSYLSNIADLLGEQLGLGFSFRLQADWHVLSCPVVVPMHSQPAVVCEQAAAHA
jgi:hypothetical protein